MYCKLAKEMGLLASIGTTAHSTVVFGVMCCDIGRARRAWLEAKYVRNTRIWAQLKPLLAR